MDISSTAKCLNFESPGGHRYRFTVVAAPYHEAHITEHTVLYSFGDDGAVEVITRVLEAVDEACRQWFGMPPAGLLRIAEVPEGYGSEASEGLILQTSDGFGRNLEGEDAFRQGLSAFGHEAIHRWHPKPAPQDRTRWLDEGLTHYLEARLLQRCLGQDAFQARMQAYRASFLSAPALAHSIPIAESGTSDHVDVISRGKGPWAFGVLHEQLGDAEFFAVLRSFAAEFRGRVARWEDLLAVAEQTSSQSLVRWTEDWIHTARSSDLLAGSGSLGELAAQYR